MLVIIRIIYKVRMVIIGEGRVEPTESLLELNARMRRIDLICKLAGPLFIALIDGVSTVVAIWLTLVLNALSLPIEVGCIATVCVRLNLHTGHFRS